MNELMCCRAELYDVLVNVESKEIAIAAHAKGELCYIYYQHEEHDTVEESCPNTVTVMGTEEANEFTKQ